MPENNATPAMNLAGASFALLAVMLWSGNFIVARFLAGQVPPVTLAFLRWLAAALIATPFCLGALRREWPSFRARWPFYLSVSFTGASGFSVLSYMAAKSTATLNLTLISTVSPLITLVLARLFLKEALTPQRLTGLALALIGVFLLAVRGDLSALASLRFQSGDLLMLGASALFAVYTVQLRFRPAQGDIQAFFALLYITAALTTLPLALLEYALTPDYFINLDWSAPLVLGFAPGHYITLNWGVPHCVLYLALMPTIVSFWSWNKAVTSIGPGNASLIYYSLPFFSGLAALLLLDEPVLAVHLVSGALILCGVLLATRYKINNSRIAQK